MAKSYHKNILTASAINSSTCDTATSFLGGVTLLILHWLKSQSTGILRLSLIQKTWLKVKPCRFTRSNITKAIDCLAKQNLVELRIDTSRDDLLLVLNSNRNK